MQSKSNKLKRKYSVSYNGNGTVAAPDALSGTAAETSDNSGKIDWTSTVDSLINGVTTIVDGITRKTPTTVVNNTTETPRDNTGLYVGLGAGALVIVLLVVLLKK